MSKGGYIDQDKVTAERREKKAKKAASAGKNKQSVEEKRFSLAREDRYVRPVASLENVSEMFPILLSNVPRWSFYAAKPEQVSRTSSVEFLDTAPLICAENVDEKWVARYWPSVLDVCKLMAPGDIQMFSHCEVQNPERIWNTTLYVKRVN